MLETNRKLQNKQLKRVMRTSEKENLCLNLKIP